MKRALLAFGIGILFVSLTQGARAQKWVNYEPDPRTMAVWVSGVEERASSRLFYWSRDAQRSNGEIFVTHGTPRWSEKMEAAMESVKTGLTWRMGNNFWSIFDTSLPLRVSGVEVPVGSYYIGINRSKDGAEWSLAFLDPQTMREKRIDAYETHLRPMPVAFSAPLSFRAVDDVTETLSIRLSADENEPKLARFELSWGKFELTAPIELMELPSIGRDLEGPL